MATNAPTIKFLIVEMKVFFRVFSDGQKETFPNKWMRAVDAARLARIEDMDKTDREKLINQYLLFRNQTYYCDALPKFIFTRASLTRSYIRFFILCCGFFFLCSVFFFQSIHFVSVRNTQYKVQYFNACTSYRITKHRIKWISTTTKNTHTKREENPTVYEI